MTELLFFLAAMGLYICCISVVLPVLIRRKPCTTAHLAFDEIPLDHQDIPLPTRRFFEQIRGDLAGNGFVPVTCIRGLSSTPALESFTAVFHQEAHGDEAVAVVARFSVSATHVREVRSVQFSVLFVDGEELSTGNNDAVGLFDKRPGWIAAHFPRMADLTMLYQAHQRRCERHRGASPRPLAKRGEYVSKVQIEMAAYHQRGVTAGHLYLDAQSGVHWLTWKGAFLASWSAAWPIRNIHRRLLYRRAKQELRSLGLPTNYAEMTLCRIRTRPRPRPGPTPAQACPVTVYCPACDYNLTGLKDNRCPECGRPFHRRRLQEQSERAPQPITRTHALRLLIQPIVLSTLGALVGRGLMAMADLLPSCARGLRTAAILIVLIAAASLIADGFLSCREVARRISVNRALRQGGERSGRKDRGFIAAVAGSLCCLGLCLGFALLVLILMW